MPQILQWAYLIQLPEMSVTLTSHCLEYFQTDFKSLCVDKQPGKNPDKFKKKSGHAFDL
jgi:hypothetical protein